VSGTAWQRAGGMHTSSSLADVIGLSSSDVISLRYLRCVRCVGWKPRFRHNQWTTERI